MDTKGVANRNVEIVPHWNALGIAVNLGIKDTRIYFCKTPRDLRGVVCAYIQKKLVVVGFTETHCSQIVNLTMVQIQSAKIEGLQIDKYIWDRLNYNHTPTLNFVIYRDDTVCEYYCKSPPDAKGLIIIDNPVTVIGAALSQDGPMVNVFTEPQLRLISLCSIKVRCNKV